MFEAYLDESGIHDGADICLVAGYFGTQTQLGKLESAWKKVLHDFDFPMEEFHAEDLTKSHRHKPMLGELAKAIAKARRVFPASFGLVVPDFTSFTLDQRKFLTGAAVLVSGGFASSGCPNKPYFVPFQNVVKLVTCYAPEGDKAHFRFGIDRPFYGYATVLFQQMTELATTAGDRPWSTWKTRDRLGTIRAPLAKETAQLQAADLLAHFTYLHMLEWRKNSGKPVQASTLLRTCLENRRSPRDTVYQDKNSLEHVLAAARPIFSTSSL